MGGSVLQSVINWGIFLYERAPPLIFLLLAAGPCLTCLYITEGYINREKFIWAVVGELLLLLLLRIMDDVKDYEKDVIVHPERPLPRGLVRFKEAIAVIKATILFLSIYAVVLCFQFGLKVGVLFGCQVLYTYLMFIEFGCGKILEQSPIIYGLVHQLSIYFGAFFICALGGKTWPDSILLPFHLGSVAFSGFFTYEICRKLDPTLPLIKGTYLVVYGKWPTFGFTMVTILVGVISSFFLGMYWLLWPLEAIMILSMLILTVKSREPSRLFVRDKKVVKAKGHKVVEGISVLYLLVHMWSGYIYGFFGTVHQM